MIFMVQNGLIGAAGAHCTRVPRSANIDYLFRLCTRAREYDAVRIMQLSRPCKRHALPLNPAEALSQPWALKQIADGIAVKGPLATVATAGPRKRAREGQEDT